MAEAPTSFGKYELLARLATGGMAETFRAQLRGAAGVTKPVVIKKVLTHLAQDPAFVSAFINEAQLSASLSHGNIAQVFDFGQVDGDYFIAMELVDGRSLHQLLDRAAARGFLKLPVPIACFIAMELLKGLHYAHTRTGEDGTPLNLVHRDVSPENVLVSYEGQTKVVDFGVAKAAMRGRTETEPGLVKGKFMFFSPEQAVAEPLDGRSDVFAVGTLLYRMLCGEFPFEGQMHNVMRAIVAGRFRPALVVNPLLPPPLAAVLAKAMATDRNARYASALEMQEAVASFLYGQEPTFSGETLKEWMTWLFAPELESERRSVKLSARFRKQLETWDPQGRPTSPSVPALEPVTRDARAKVTRNAPEPPGLPAAAPSEPITLEDRKAVTRTARGVPTGVWLGGGAVVLAGLVYVGANLGELFGAEPEHVTAAQEAVQRNAQQASAEQRVTMARAAEKEQLAQATASLEALDWDGAAQRLDRCIAAGSCGLDAVQLRATIDAERPLKAALDRAEQALEKKELGAAQGELDRAEPITLLHKRYLALVDRLRTLRGALPHVAAAPSSPWVEYDNSDEAARRVALAREAIANYDFPKARDLLHTCRLKGQPCPEALKLLAQMDRDHTAEDNMAAARRAVQQGDLSTAQSEIGKVGARGGTVPAPRSSVAQKLIADSKSLLKTKQYGQARSMLEACLSFEPHNPDCHRLLGTVLTRMGDAEKGNAEYREFLRSAPPNHPELEAVKQMVENYEATR